MLLRPGRLPLLSLLCLFSACAGRPRADLETLAAILGAARSEPPPSSWSMRKMSE